MSNRLFDWLNRFLVPLAGKINNNRYLRVLRDAFMLAFPLTIFGSIAVVLVNLPFLEDVVGEAGVRRLQALLGHAPESTMGILSVFIVFGIGYYLSRSYEVEPIYGGAVALASFLLVTPFTLVAEGGQEIGGVIPLDRLGAKGMFVGIIVGMVSTEIYRWIVQRDITIKMPAGVPEAVSKSFASLIPVTVTLSFFLAVNILFQELLKSNIHDVIYEVVQKPLVGLGSGLVPTLIAIFFVQLLWFFGLHGQIIVNSVMDPIWNTLSLENLEAFQRGAEVPHIINKQFIEIFTVAMGGSGMTLAVVVALLLFMRSKQLNQVGKLAIAPGIFNVNEPVIFGLPVVMNPLIVIPWILAPMVVVAVTYFAMKLGLVPPPTGVTVPWTVPIFISGVLATNSLAGGLMQIVNFLIVLAIWMPFLLALDRMNLQREAQSAGQGGAAGTTQRRSAAVSG